MTSDNEFVGNGTTEENGHYFTHYFGEELEAPKDDKDNLQRTGEPQDGKLQDNSEARSFSFLEDFFIRLPQTLGLKRMVCIVVFQFVWAIMFFSYYYRTVLQFIKRPEFCDELEAH